jgi:hypothetical protein
MFEHFYATISSLLSSFALFQATTIALGFFFFPQTPSNPNLEPGTCKSEFARIHLKDICRQCKARKAGRSLGG